LADAGLRFSSIAEYSIAHRSNCAARLSTSVLKRQPGKSHGMLIAATFFATQLLRNGH
jgi:hypothetical protein